MDRKKKLRIIAAALCVILIAGVVLNQSGLLKRAEAESIWSGDFPSNMTAVNYTYGTDASGKSGNGTEKSPYYIASADDLAQMQVNINGGLYGDKEVYFKLVQTINLANAAGKAWRPIGDNKVQARIHFDGGSDSGYKIIGMKLESTGSTINQGFFGYLSGGSVKNLDVEGAELSLSTIGGSSAGGIVGLATDACKITNCSFAGTITGYSDVGGICGTCDGGSIINGCSVASGSQITGYRQRVGGVVGNMQKNSLVINCSNAGAVKLEATSATANASYSTASGIVGYTESSEVVNSYNRGNVSSKYLASGITTAVGGAVRNCYNWGSVAAEATGRAGSIAASITSVTQMRNVFALQGTANNLITDGTGGNTNMQNVGSFEAGQFVSKADFLDGAKWTLGSDTLLKTALDDYVVIGIGTYDNICEWAEDTANANGGYPILTNKVGHVHDKQGAQTVKKEATCYDTGIVENRCSQCGLIYEEEIPKKTHKQITVSTPASCEAEGITTIKCENTWHDEDGNEVACDYVFSTSTQPALGHRYYEGTDKSKYEVSPDCVTDGYYVEFCIRQGCGHEEESTRVTADQDEKYKAKGHTWEEYDSDPASCTEPECHYQKCAVCKEVQTVTGPAVALGHDWDDENGIYRPSTCIQEGGNVRKCNRCNIEEFVGMPEEKVPHKYVTENAVEATCTTKGYTEMICEVCQLDSSRIQVNFVNPTGHNFVLDSVVESTCAVQGYDHEVCTNRGCTETRDVNLKPLKPHNYVVSNNTDASCLTGGLIEETCQVCGDVITTRIPPIGHHDYHPDPELSTPATCTEDGQDIERCLVCQNVQVVNTITALGHSLAEVETPATCLFGGFTTETCERGCGYERIFNEVGPLGHNMIETKYEATTTSMGYTESKCSRCDESKEYNFIAATPDATYDAVSATLIFNPTPAAVEVEPVMLFLEMIAPHDGDEKGEVMAYSLDKVEWVTTDALSVKITEDDLIFTTDSALNTAMIYVKRPGNNASEERPILESTTQSLEISRAEMPDIGGIVGDAPLSENGLGRITGVDETMEWRAEADKTWTPVVGNTIENLKPGIYYVRAKANGSKLAGDEIMVKIAEYGANPNPPTDDPDHTTAPPDGPNNTTAPPDGPNNTTVPPDGPNSTTAPPDGPNNTTAPPNGDGSGSGSNGNGSGNNGGNSGTNGSGSGNNGGNSGTNGNGSGGTTVDSNGNVVPNNVYYSSGNSGTSSSGSSKSSNSSTRVTSARTSDEMSLAVWLVVAGVAVTGFALVTAKRRRDVEE